MFNVTTGYENVTIDTVQHLVVVNVQQDVADFDHYATRLVQQFSASFTGGNAMVATSITSTTTGLTIDASGDDSTYLQVLWVRPTAVSLGVGGTITGTGSGQKER